MSGHRVRTDLNDYPAISRNEVDGSYIDARNEYGHETLIEGSSGVETRNLVPPVHGGQEICITAIPGDATSVAIVAPSGQTLDGTNDTITWTSYGNLVLRSWTLADGHPEWRVLGGLGGGIAS